ncbi:unnamed protein product [Effrenium voratum]|uniref:Uncharacterized protein n=1 Tax=Effrenium voratum TaxID=2562239 RepID=A0AA36N8V6_9DINO|nr:unnamed protein product [Effrenium voratum]
MRATLPSARVVSDTSLGRGPRRSFGARSQVLNQNARPTQTQGLGAAAATSSGPIGQALLEKVNAVSGKLEVILGRQPLTSRFQAPQSLGEKLLDLTERLGRLERLLDEWRTRGSFTGSLVNGSGGYPRMSAEAAAEASVKAVAKSLLEAARRSPSGAPVMATPVPVLPQVVRQQSRSTTPVTTSRVRTPGRPDTTWRGVSVGPSPAATPPSVPHFGGLTPPPGLFLPANLGLGLPLESLAQNARLSAAHVPVNAVSASAPSGAASVASGATPRSVGYAWDGRLSPPMAFSAPAPLPVAGASRTSSLVSRTSVAPPRPGTLQLPPKVQDAEMKLRKWLETIPIGNGSERGWDDGQIREIAEFANKYNISNLSAEQLYQRLGCLRLAVLVGRRALWDRLQQKDDGDASEVFKFFAAMLQVLLAMGFPVHRCCLPLAAWVGSLELLQVLSQRGGEKEFSRLGGVDNLLSWAARGIYSQPKAQSEVLEWLCNQKADPNHRDAAGRSVLDWACWAGCEELVSMLLRRGRMATREPEVQPLLLATSSRSVGLVRLLLRAAGDPHALPRGQSDAGHACGALLLAVRCCEYELACEMLKSAAFVNVDLALGASPRRERGAAQDEEKPAGAATRATIVLVESLRRFCSGLQRRSVEEVSVTGVRTHVPGPHPDECLYATPTMPLGDVLHPLAAQLPSPMHRVPLELRPGVLPMAWLRRTREEPWTSARMMVECFLQRGFKADEAFLTKVMPALPPEVQNLTRRLAEGGYPPPLPTLLTTMPDMRRASVTEKSPTTMYGLAWLHNGKTKLSKTFAEPAKDYWLRPKAMEDVKPSIANAADYMKVPWSPVRSGWAEEEASQLPAIRVVVLGAPRVGKSSVVQVLADYLQVHCEEDDGPAWLRVVPGRWPTSGSPVVQVCLWDTTSTFSPLPYLVTDPDAATFAVAVVDSFGSAETSDAVAMAQRCMSTEGSVSAPRRALVVENCFSGGASHMPDKALATIQCSVMSEEGQSNLKRTFGKMIAEMVGQIEARAEASRGENSFGALAQCGQGDFRSVLARDTAFPCNARKPLGKRALAYRLRGDSTYVDPTAASIAWAAVCAARSTLPQEVQHLTGSSPSTSSWRMALVSQERLATVLELGHGRQSSATLQRALLDLGLICPVQAVDSPGSVLVPDFAERMKLSKALVQQMLDAASQVYVRVLWSHWERVPQAPHFLRTALQNLLKGSLGYSSTAKQLVLHHFALLEEDSGEVSDLGSGFLVAFELAEECCNRESFEGSLPELLGVPEITCVTVRCVSGGAWDVLCSGPHAHWAWHALLQGTCFAGFKVLASPGKGEADWPMPACLLSTAPLDEKNARKADEEEMAAAAWLLCGPQAKEARERLVSGLDRQKALGFAACCAAVLGRRPQLDLGTRNLSAEFEMCLLARSWHEMPYLLNEALLSVESWAICAAALARLARDAAVCAGRCGSQLPLLAGDSVALLPEGPQLLQKEAVELTQNVLKGDITPALQAWLTICRPIALWVWAGAAKGFCAPVGSSFAEEKLDVGSQVVKAVRAAVACFLSEAAILEVWDLLKDPNLGRMLLPRPGGGWMWLDPDTDWPL